jgi:hypothetical protein
LCVGSGASPADWSFSSHPDEAEFNLFRYCGNDPVDFTDPMGLDSGPFDSPDLAAAYAHSIVNPISIRDNREYGLSIYRDVQINKWFTTDPKAGTEKHAFQRNPIPEGKRYVKEYDQHFHGAYSRDDGYENVTRSDKAHDNLGSDHFSRKDEKWYSKEASKDQSFKGGYVGTPGNSLLKRDANEPSGAEHHVTIPRNTPPPQMQMPPLSEWRYRDNQ